MLDSTLQGKEATIDRRSFLIASAFPLALRLGLPVIGSSALAQTPEKGKAMSEPTQRIVETNGIRLNVAEQGQGPLVLLCHGFPEILVLLAPPARRARRGRLPRRRARHARLRQERPAAKPSTSTRSSTWSATWSACSTRCEAPTAVIVGHDWGATVAWHAALLRPDRFRAVVGLSVPFRPRGKVRPDQHHAAHRGRSVLSALFPGARRRRGGAGARSAARTCATCSTARPATRRAARGAGIGMVPRGGGFLRGARRARRRCLPGSASAMSISTPASSRAPASAAASTGIATSTATGSCWRPSPARR